MVQSQAERQSDATRASHALLQATMDSSLDMIQVFVAVRDDRGEIVDFRWVLNNYRSESLYGEVRGESLLERNPGVIQEGIFDRFKRVTETGVSEQAEHHYAHEQFDGWFYQSVVKLGDGVATTTKDISEWKASQEEVLRLQRQIAEARLNETRNRFGEIFAHAPVGISVISADGRFVRANRALCGILGRASGELLRLNVIDVTHPDHVQQSLDTIARAADTGQPQTLDKRYCRPDGTEAWASSTVTLMPPGEAPDDEPRFLIVTADLTARKVAEEALRRSEASQRVLITELQHRTGNLLGIVRSVADRTIVASDDLAQFRTRFHDRIDALARAQALVSRHDRYDHVTFDELVHTELAPVNVGADRVTLDGPPGIRLRSSAVQMLAMALHELVTNAVKYGALGQPRGRLAIRWSLEAMAGDGRLCLRIDWRESGVTMPPSGAGPQGTGQGRELIEGALPYQFGAETVFTLGADGVHCTIAIPIARIEGRDAEA